MNYFTTITQKGQITIPKEVRDALGFKQHLKVSLEVEKDKEVVKIKPVKDILDLAGNFKTKKKESVLEARKSFENNYQRT